MKSKKGFIFVVFLLGISQMVSAYILNDADEIEQYLYDVSINIGCHFISTTDKIDSIEATLSDKEWTNYTYVFAYTDAYRYFSKGNYRMSLLMADSALVYFLYNQQNEWAARSLMLIAYVSEARNMKPEAISAYKLIIDMAKDPRTLASAYLNLAVNSKAIGKDWESYLEKGKTFAELSDCEYVRLGARLKSYWLRLDSNYNEAIEVAEEYHQLECHTKEGDAYRALVFYYIIEHQYDSALVYADKAIDAYNNEEKPIKVLLASMHYLKGKVYLMKKDKEGAYGEFNIAVSLNNRSLCKENNYHIYRSMYRHEYAQGKYKEACFLLEQALNSYKKLSDSRVFYSDMMNKIFNKISLIEEELEVIKRQTVRRTILLILVLIAFFSVIIAWLINRKQHYECKSKTVEGENMKLKEETGELLVKANENKIKSNIIENQFVVERRLERLLSQHTDVLGVIKERYGETMLCFDLKLPMLSQSEKRFAVMIALGVSHKIIAELLSVKPETVGQYRNRIRKKLGISNTDVDLNDYLNSFLED